MLNKLIVLCGLIFILSCSERDKGNPFDVSGDISLSLDITSADKRVELTWSSPQVDGYSGFNIYRMAEGYDDSFKRIAMNLSPGTRKYIDDDIQYERTYIYNITISGLDIESSPSENVSISPGPGFIWIVDKWGFQIVKTTYDLQNQIVSYDTDWPPTNMALSKELGVGLVLYLSSNTIEKINLNGERVGRYNQIKYPMDIVYDQVNSLFWIVDSSGTLYSFDTRIDQISEISQSLSKPTTLSLAADRKLICVTDRGKNEIVQFNQQGNIVQTISSINEKKLSDPIRFVIDEVNNKTWLVDRQNEFDYIYIKGAGENEYTLLDSVHYRSELHGDLELNMQEDASWLISYNGQNSAVVQLSATGSRQLELSGYYNPYDIQINPYDETLLVADSGHSIVLHYNRDNNLIGQSKNLQFPVKVLVE